MYLPCLWRHPLISAIPRLWGHFWKLEKHWHRPGHKEQQSKHAKRRTARTDATKLKFCNSLIPLALFRIFLIFPNCQSLPNQILKGPGFFFFIIFAQRFVSLRNSPRIFLSLYITGFHWFPGLEATLFKDCNLESLNFPLLVYYLLAPGWDEPGTR